MSETQTCPHCGTEMQELSRRWGEETYMGMLEYIEYGCSVCGERIEDNHDVPVELLPFMPPDDDYDNYNDDDYVPDPFEEMLANCGMTPEGDCMLAGTEHCDWKCAVPEWFADELEDEQP